MHRTGDHVSQSYLSVSEDRGVAEVKQNHTVNFTSNIRKFIRRGALHSLAASYCRTSEFSFLPFKPVLNGLSRAQSKGVEGQARAEDFITSKGVIFQRRFFRFYTGGSAFFRFGQQMRSMKLKVCKIVNNVFLRYIHPA